MSLFNIQGQHSLAQVATQTSEQLGNTDNPNVIVGENGLIAVLPMDNVDVNPDNGLIAVVPGIELPSVPLASTGTTQVGTETNGLIAVVPNAEPIIVPIANVEQDEPDSPVIAQVVQEVSQLNDPITVDPITVEANPVAEQIVQQTVVQTEPSNVTEYVQDAIQNTIFETPAITDTQDIIGTAKIEKTNDEVVVSSEENTVDTNVGEVVESLQKVTITVSEEVEDNVIDTTFDVKAQLVEADASNAASELVTRISSLMPTDIDAVGSELDYGHSLTAENTFIGHLMEAPLPSDKEATEIVTREIQNTTIPELETVVEPETEIVEQVKEEVVEEIVNEDEKVELTEEEIPDLTAIAKGTQFIGKLNLNDSINDVLATDPGEAIFHTYQIDVPEGQEVLTIMVEGKSGDVDFAVKAGSEITSYTEVDYIDNSGSSSSSYSYQFPPSGPIFIDVMNYTEEPIAYELTVSDDYNDAVSSSYDGSTENILAVRNRTGEVRDGPLETGHFFDLSLNSVLSREIVGKEPSATMVYHSYEVALPKGLEDVEVVLDGQGHDVDIAVRLGNPIVRLDEVDFFDNSSASKASYMFETLQDTVVYIDVMNYLQEAAHYELQVIADGVALENTASEIDSIRTYAPAIDTEAMLEAGIHNSEDVTTLKAGQRYEGSIANYLKVGQELSAMAESQSFLIRVPEGTNRFVVTLAADEDLDLALKYASPIESYVLKKQGGDWHYLDMRPTTDSRIQVDAPQAGFWYIDVIQATYGKGAAPYTLQVFYP